MLKAVLLLWSLSASAQLKGVAPVEPVVAVAPAVPVPVAAPTPGLRLALDPSAFLTPAQSLAAGLASGRLWHLRALEKDPTAMALAQGRLAAAALPQVRAAVGSAIADAARRHGLALERVAGIYLDGSAIWGHKNIAPKDLDLIAVVEGEALEGNRRSLDLTTLVAQDDPRVFTSVLAEESAGKAPLPLNLKLVSRAYIEGYPKRGRLPDEAFWDVPNLDGDWGHGVQVYGEDALAAHRPSSQALLAKAANLAQNAGKFLGDYVFRVSGQAAQPMSPVQTRGLEEVQRGSIIPKTANRLLEARLILKTVAEREGLDPSRFDPLGEADADEAYRGYFTGERHTGLPSSSDGLTEEVIRISNASSGAVERLKSRLRWGPAGAPWARRRWLEPTAWAVLLGLGSALGAGWHAFAAAALVATGLLWSARPPAFLPESHSTTTATRRDVRSAPARAPRSEAERILDEELSINGLAGIPEDELREATLRAGGLPSEGELHRAVARVAEHVGVINRTEFFRDPRLWRELRPRLDDLIDARARRGERSLTLKSLGGSDGSEAYSLAMLVDDLLRRRGEDPAAWDVRIEVYDFNPVNRIVAALGYYRGAPKGWERYFEAGPDGLSRVRPELRRWVFPRALELTEPSQWERLAERPGQALLFRYVQPYLHKAQLEPIMAWLRKGRWATPEGAAFVHTPWRRGLLLDEASDAIEPIRPPSIPAQVL